MSTATTPSSDTEDEVDVKLADFRQEIRVGRTVARMSQSELAAAVGRTQRWMSGIESGAFIPRVSDAIVIAEILRPALGRNILEVLIND